MPLPNFQGTLNWLRSDPEPSPSSHRTADTALPYTPHRGPATACAPRPSVRRGSASHHESTAGRPDRASAAQSRTCSDQCRCDSESSRSSRGSSRIVRFQVAYSAASTRDTGGPMAAILFVRIKSRLEVEEFDRRLLERKSRFHEVPGLVQKVYGRDGATGDVCGIYFFESQEALTAFGETELARTIPDAYDAVDVRREVYDVLYPLWPERGPCPALDRAAEASA